jgi:hypothetical protein
MSDVGRTGPEYSEVSWAGTGTKHRVFARGGYAHNGYGYTLSRTAFTHPGSRTGSLPGSAKDRHRLVRSLPLQPALRVGCADAMTLQRCICIYTSYTKFFI